ncbi:hypothetical protein [Novipirellula rosea]
MSFREVKCIRFKRIHIRPGTDDKAGHWWFEIGDPTTPMSESFGWWPAEVLSYPKVFLGVEGCLNGGRSKNNPYRDPHHAESADEEFFPLVKVDDVRTDKQIADCLRYFALNYHGSWQWFIGWGQNCHNFQRAALQHCELIVSKSVQRVKL